MKNKRETPSTIHLTILDDPSYFEEHLSSDISFVYLNNCLILQKNK